MLSIFVQYVIPSTTRNNSGTTTYNPANQKSEAGGSEVQGSPWLLGEFEDNLSYMRLCLKRAGDGRRFQQRSLAKDIGCQTR